MIKICSFEVILIFFNISPLPMVKYKKQADHCDNRNYIEYYCFIVIKAFSKFNSKPDTREYSKNKTV